MISESYRELNRKLHDTNPHYGTSGHKFAQYVVNLCKAYKTTEILDYGCGKQTLNDSIEGVEIKGYDPCIEGLDETPEPHDIVVCTDVMEHIEPEHLESVIKDIYRVTKKALFMTIACRPAVKFLEDGRNAHLIQEDFRWWLPKLWDLFDVKQMLTGDGEILVVCEPRELN